MVEESHDPTGQGVGVACDTELDEQGEPVVIGAFADEVGPVGLEDRNYRQVDPAAQAGFRVKPVAAAEASWGSHARVTQGRVSGPILDGLRSVGDGEEVSVMGVLVDLVEEGDGVVGAADVGTAISGDQ